MYTVLKQKNAVCDNFIYNNKKKKKNKKELGQKRSFVKKSV